MFINNIIDSCTTGASWTSEYKKQLLDYNCWSNNGADVSTSLRAATTSRRIALLVAPATGDFTLGAGSPCLDAGLQMGTNIGATGDYKVNVGADQDDNTAVGGAAAGGHILIF